MKPSAFFTIRSATSSDAASVYNIMAQAANAQMDKTLFICDDFNFVSRHISEEGFTVVACNEESKVIASLIIRYPMSAEDNLGRDIGLNYAALLRVAHMESAVVLPCYRGMGLQRQLLLFAESVIDKNKYQYLLATVSPDNPASYRSFERCGYTHVMTKEKYGGLQRRIYQKEL
ncbi:MAG: GNAT family N-acetyltransferase [Lachnospiraceae bacterium]|nr:GNAT family N-acetyltransferase [Lachnospiraceae bacterium]